MNKKLIALVLAFALVFSSFTAAFADTAIPVDAQATKDLGMLLGGTSGVTLEYLNTTPTRLQAAIMFLRLKGLEQTALSYTGTANFDDANLVQWVGGRNIMAYLKNNPQLGWVGVGNNKFSPELTIDAAGYYKVMLETLGYKQGTDFEWTGVVAFAAQKGLVKVANVTNYTVNGLATATIEALKAAVKGGTKTLATQLVETGVINAAAATAAGVYTAPVVALAVESVSATNLKEIVVVFNKAVDKDSAEDKTNYTLEVDNVGVAINKAVLQADGKTVLVTLTSEFAANGLEFDLAIEDVKDMATGVVADTTVTAAVNDIAAPVALSTTLVGPNTFEITFNEPVDKDFAGKVEVDGTKYPVASANATDARKVVVSLSDSELIAGNYKVTVADFKDLAGHKMVAKELTLAYAKDTTAPTATIVSADQTEVVIQFNEKVFAGDPDATTPLDANYFYHSISSYKPSNVATTDNKKFTLTFPAANNPLPEGNVKVVVVADVDDEVITDAWGNEVAANIVLSAVVKADTTKPTVTKIETDGQDTIEITFSEDVVAADAVDFENYVVLNASGEEQVISDITYSNVDDEFVATIEFNADLEPGNYTVKVADIYDNALDANKITAATVSFAVADEKGPIVPATSIAVDGTSVDTIYVDFGDDMASTGSYSALNKDNYQIDGEDLATADTVSFFNGDKSIVKITIADEDAYTFAAPDNDSAVITIARLADVNNNKMIEFSDTTAVAKENALAINSVRILDGKTIEIRVNAHIKDTTAASAFEVSYMNGAYATLSGIKSITWVAPKGATPGYTKVIALLKANQQVAKDLAGNYETAIAATDYDVRAVANAVKSIYGTAMDTAVYSNSTDKFVATLETITKTVDKKIVLTFTEDIAFANGGNNVLAATDLVVTSPDGDRLVPNSDYTVSVVDNTVVITIADIEAGTYSVSTATVMNYLADGSDNIIGSVAKTIRLQ
jgi:methionine-rich copper-binding protein CopC